LGFLKGRQILDAIGTAHECLHSIKMKKLKALILKLDLKKAYDCINWDFLRLTLLQTGFSLTTTNWIMSCVISASFAVLINGETSPFFQSGRGLRQGCPLSPLLFILVMEGLSLLLKKGQVEGKLSGVKVSRIVKILHLFFVDDVLIMTKASIQEWKEINDLLKIFCSASGMKVNLTKSTFHYFGIQGEILEKFKEAFPYNFVDLSEGFRYLRYFLKAEKYKVEEWRWLIAKFEKRIGHWCNRWLSLGGRFILIKAVLESQPVYWMALAAIPVSVLNKIRQLIFNFLWSGCSEKQHLHLCSWEIIAKPKLLGGWGLRNIFLFNRALAANSLWRVLMKDGIWHRVIKDKYLPYCSVSTWFRTTTNRSISASQTWKNLLKSLHLITHWLSWSPGSGHSVIIGKI
jgi:hypothetical protein